MQEFQVFRAGPLRRPLLKVVLDGDHLTISGHAPLVSSLAKNGVTDFSSGRCYKIQKNLEGPDAPAIFEALKSRFQRDSAYKLHDSPKDDS